MIQISRPHFSDEQRRRIHDGIDRVMTTGRLINGPFAAQLEEDFARQTGVAHAICVNSCTTALMICLASHGVREGEILVPAGSFTTDVSVVRWSGAKPVLVDIDPETLSFDLADLERKVTPRTKGIIWVHLTGLIASNYRAIVDFAKQRNLFLLEDCAHSQGARTESKAAGSIGHAGCFSFFATKGMTSGVGGMITTNDPSLDRFAREMRFFGRGVGSRDVVCEGNDWLLDEFRACIALAQLGEYEDMIARRRSVAARYIQALANQPGIQVPNLPDQFEHAYYQFAVLLRDRALASAVGQSLGEKHGIEAKRIYLPVHQEKIFREYDDGTLKATEATLHRSLCLPMHAAITDEEADRVALALVAEVRSRL